MTLDASTGTGTVGTGSTNQVTFQNIETLNITGTNYDDWIIGGNGNDTLYGGGGGNDSVNGGAGDDNLTNYEQYGSSWYGTIRTATLNGDDGSDILQNYQSNNSSDNVVLNGGAGNDTLTNSSSSFWSGGWGISDNVTLNGGTGDDQLSNANSYGTVSLNGGDGNDTLQTQSSHGNVTLTGGAGNDTFRFNDFINSSDTITDFAHASDIIAISAAGFGGGLLAGSLDVSQFAVGTAAATANELFIYDNTTGALYFDQDGSGAAFTQVEIVGLSAGLSLSANDFILV
jgi:Ca2+-binding RTX toxin-like protein